jgi:hypothetical protein
LSFFTQTVPSDRRKILRIVGGLLLLGSGLFQILARLETWKYLEDNFHSVYVLIVSTPFSIGVTVVAVYLLFASRK